MFLLYALVIGIALGLLTGGRLEPLSRLTFRWPWLAVAGLGVQLVLFTPPLSDHVGDAGPLIHVASIGTVLAFLVANWHVAGVPVMIAGAACNLVVILANGGSMPASAAALHAAGLTVSADGYTNSRELAAPVLAPLGDVFALPGWLPLANVFSVGDVVLGVGVVVALVAAMHGVRPATAGTPGHAPPSG